MSSPASNKDTRRTAWAVAAVILIGIAAIWHATLGFRVVGTEEGRRLSIAEAPLAVPPVQAALASGAGGTLPALLAADGRTTLATFIYTRCNAVCSVLGTEMQQLQREIRARGLQHRIRLLSISFDEHDTPGVLAAYAQRMQADPEIWHFAAIPHAAERRALLDGFGVVVIAAPLGEFQHNAAFHTLTPDGRLTAITDIDTPPTELLSTVGSHPKVDTVPAVPSPEHAGRPVLSTLVPATLVPDPMVAGGNGGMAGATFAGALERSMVLHMFVLLPLIAVAGALLAPRGLLRHWRRCDAYGLASFTLLLFVSAYWMIPRALELSLTQPLAEAGKFASLLLLGAVLPDAVRRSNAVIQLFFIGNFCWMGAIAGIQYQNLPQRLCNAYPLDQQVLTGTLLVGASIAVALAWCIRHFPSGELHEHRTF